MARLRPAVKVARSPASAPFTFDTGFAFQSTPEGGNEAGGATEEGDAMKLFPRLTLAALLAFGLQAAPASAQSADRINSSDLSLRTETGAVPDAEARRGGFRGGRFHGGRFRGARFHHRPVYAARFHAPRPHWRRHYHGPRIIYRPAPVYGYSCVRRGWVWNGWQYVWRRYRVC